ncbi:outer membrane beta-barrel protein [Seonamhaeicola marinus]|uniref:TonB-dependent receptor n=1 Tax=Seonamhaeicola marinus TaxID=1912246 RepID=A0A5D0HKR8_9FLAO|nr:outer membrane beta-barrel protein [Seonamhaeicola marinus]TYA71888.1 TonB-dependent receptor [Seonamhaeicola marinus]
MIKRLLLLSFLFLFYVSFGQNFSLKGVVKDEANTPIAFSNIVLLLDNEIIDGTTSNESGVFSFESLKTNTYKIKISYLGFQTFEKEIELIGNIDLGTLLLRENAEALEGVTVVAKRPTVKRLVDRLVFNVENSTLSNNNVLDVLKHTPGVLVHDGSITVKNSAPTVYINDRRVHLSADEVLQLLESTPAENIKSIEVITNPPAKYEAEGGAVLNIVTSKNIVAGYHGSVFGSYKQGFEFPKYSIGTSHFFKTKKLSTYINYNISPRKDYREKDEFVNFIENNTNTSSWETDYNRDRESRYNSINANIDYDFDEKNSIGLTTNMLIAPRRNSQTDVKSSTKVFGANKVLDSTFNTFNESVLESFNMAFTLDYVHKFSREGEQLLVSLHHTNYDYSNFQNVDTDYLFPNNSLIRENRFQTFSSQVIKLNTSQLDYELPINESTSFEAGIKTSHIDSESVLTQYNFEEEERIEDIDNSDNFFYDEENYAAYVSLAKDWEKLSLKVGVRTEYTETTGTSVSENEKSENNYFKIFPSVHVSKTVNDKHELYFNYNKRIYRPRYNQLNPFKFFLNDNSYITGDPRLVPQVDDVFTLGYTLNDTYTFELYYRYENDPAIEIAFQDNEENILKYVNTNINRSISYGFDFMTYTAIAKGWNLYALTSLFYYDNKYVSLESGNQINNTDKWSVYAQIANYFTFLKDNSLTADVSLQYISPLADGPSIVSDRFGLDISLRKTFLKNKASLSIGVTDIFNTQNFNQSTKYLNQDILMQSRMENRQFTVAFNYKFGNTKLKSNKKSIDLNERDRLERSDL